eukprot:TRINITY_DN7265_c0_g1_i1.p2 TRINITY_DN7265_c0_g1~~TRINITY_DN7265_c0_g1_i1.p2  ORF type:complete len:471 (-),score=104.58 TRINITY_DN7265_c0_g1_i1:1821-3233(-)
MSCNIARMDAIKVASGMAKVLENMKITKTLTAACDNNPLNKNNPGYTKDVDDFADRYEGSNRVKPKKLRRKKVNKTEPYDTKSNIRKYTPTDYSLKLPEIGTLQKPEQKLSKVSKETSVPSSRSSRIWHFGGLVAGLGAGAVSEAMKRTIGSTSNSSLFLTKGNATRLANSLSRMRGAALKVGQMLSIQDEALLPAEFADILERVRQNADSMPLKQVNKVLRQELGDDWNKLFKEFDEKPIAAASIGQVHKAINHENREVAVKIQYPGVAESIDSDLNNLASFLKMAGILPPGMYLDKTISVAKTELKNECNYIKEASYHNRMRNLLLDDDAFFIPEVISEMSATRVLTTEYIYGIPVNEIENFDQDTRNWVSACILRLTLKELFQFRFMQTDPNWGNFFWNPETRKINLIDFGACREFDIDFVETYLDVVASAARGEKQKVIDYSIKLGFLTGQESDIMNEVCSSYSLN